MADNEYDIAIVGMSCRFPGANTIDQFWHNLSNGIDSITRFTDEEMLRCGVPAKYIDDPYYVKAAPVIDDPEFFDAVFFGFAPMEAKMIDPQHRILLELAYETLEDAGCNPDRYSGRIGVFTGSALNTYFMNRAINSRFAEDYIPTLIGNDKDFISTRISYKLNLKGPSLNIQTACSTSLVAVHLACQSLLNGESDAALAGAISVKVPHRAGYFYDGGGIVSPDGCVKAFDSNANGTVFGSGGGMVLLKRLSDAVEEGDNIYAVIKGSAVNNDGSEKAGYTAPSVNSQADVVVEALANSGIDAEKLSYIEAHGSGTPVGDPIEVLALTKAIRAFTEKVGFCAIGSVKTNVGHLDAAAGMASLVKTALALKNRRIPASLHFSKPNPEIDFQRTPFYVNTKLADWPAQGRRTAGVLATGMGGTNAFLVLEEAHPPKVTDVPDASSLLIFSAKSESALDAMTQRLGDYLKNDDSINIADVAYTLQVGRKGYDYRRCLVCSNNAEAFEIISQNNLNKMITAGPMESVKRPVVFMFPGIGDHYLGMASELYHYYDLFREEFDRCASLLNGYLKIDIHEILYPAEGNWKKKGKKKGIDLKQMLGKQSDNSMDPLTERLNRTIYAHPAQFTIEYALAQLWINLGVKPDVIVGHSMGEYLAACIAGVMKLEDALRLVSTRARLANELPQGAMFAVMLTEAELLPLLTKDLSIALINGPNLCVVAGPASDMASFENILKEKKVIYRPVHNAHAFHSRMMDPIVHSFEAEVKRVDLKKPEVPFISNVTGNWISPEDATDPVYWAKHASHTARFNDALYNMWQYKNAVILEVGPGRTLGMLAMQHPERQNAGSPVIISSLRDRYNNQNDVAYFFQGVGNIWLSGKEVDWEKLDSRKIKHLKSLPTYPFEKQKYWIEPKENLTMQQSRKPEIKSSNIADWFYVPSWKRTAWPKKRDNLNKEVIDHDWMVFAAEEEIEQFISSYLRKRGVKITSVILGKNYKIFKEGGYEINAGSTEDYLRMLKDFNKGHEQPLNIIHTGCFTTKGNRVTNNLEFYKNAGFYSLLFIAQAIGELGISRSINIGVLSNHIHEVNGEEEICPEKATVLGACGVIPNEMQNINCFNVDVSGDFSLTNFSESNLEKFVTEFFEMQKVSLIAYRGRYKWIKDYQPLKISTGEIQISKETTYNQERLKRNGVYLITGGTGGIGLEIANYLASSYKARLILTKKSEFPKKSMWGNFLDQNEIGNATSRIIKKIIEIEKLGGIIEVYQADAADAQRMHEVITEGKKQFGSIDGVIHAAGIVRAGIIQAKEKMVADSVLSPKVNGTLILYDLIKDSKIDFLVLFSSVNTVVNPYALSDYCAANSFLDAFAHYSNVRDRFHTITINWPGWKDVGIIANLSPQLGVKAWKEAALKKAINSKDGITAFKIALGFDVPQVIISPEDLNSLIKENSETDYIATYIKDAYDKENSIDKSRAQLATSELPKSDIEIFVADIWQKTIGIKPIGLHENFIDLGGHSLLAMQIVTKIRNAFQIDFTIRSFFEGPSIAQISSAIEDKLLKEIDKLSEMEASLLVSEDPK